MKILLTGKNGQVGFELRRSLALLGEVIAMGRADCDLTDADAIRRCVAAIRPEVIVNSAAYTRVDEAESDRDAAFAVNAAAPGVLGEAADRLGALVIHYSTEYVFDGAKTGAYCEDDPTHPQSVYGHSKREGEIALAKANPRHLILRTSWVAGAEGGNFARSILRLACERETLDVVADQYGAPTSAALLADLTAHLVRQWQREGGRGFPYGLYHLSAAGETHWCDYARWVVSKAIQAGKPVKLLPEAIRGISAADYPAVAKRPANSRLDTRKFRDTFGLTLPHWQQGLEHVLQALIYSASGMRCKASDRRGSDHRTTQIVRADHKSVFP